MIVLQDEVNEKVVSLCIRGGKISAQILKASLQKLLREMEQSQKRQKISGKGQKKETVYHGKQSMEKLKAHNQELSNIEVTDGNIRSFEKYARKYDIDYCLKKDRSAEPPKYYVFFKAKEVDSITAAFKEYTGWQLKKSKKVSVRKKLYLAMERVAKHRQHKKKPESEVMTVLKKIGQDIAGQMPAVDKKRLLMMNIPYVIVFYLADKLAWLYRFCVGESAIERLGVLFLNFQMAFSNPILSLHIFDMAVGMITTVVIKAMVYLKGKNAKKFRQGEEYGSARWSA